MEEEIALWFTDNGEGKGKGGSDTEFARDFDRSAMQLNNVLDDGQAQTSTTLLAAARWIGTVEPFEQAREVLLGNAGARIPDAHPSKSSFDGS